MFAVQTELVTQVTPPNLLQSTDVQVKLTKMTCANCWQLG